MAGTNVIVTGGCGRIGRMLVERLAKGGDKVTVIDTKHGDVKGVNYIAAPINEIKELKNVHIVYHLAASIDYKASKDQLREKNILPTAKLLSLCKGAEQFIILSTSSVYNEFPNPITELTNTKPYTNYGWSKLECERLVRGSGLPYTVMRSSQVYGPDFESGYSSFLKHIQAGDMRVFGHGNNFIPLVHVNDLLDALLLVRRNKSAINQVFNVDGDYHKTQNEFMELTANLLGVEPITSHINPAMAKLMGQFNGKSSFVVEYIDKLTKNRQISISKLRELGFEPKVDLETGIKEVIQAFKERGIIE
jgi:nucleoside-diphosphate-sugar epimerase